MFSLLILTVFGLAVAYFATQNTGQVHIIIANYLIQGVPLYIIVVGSMIFGIFISWIISLANSVSSGLRIHGKNAELKNANNTIISLKKENNALAMENNHLKNLYQNDEKINNNNFDHDKFEKNETVQRPSFLHRIRHTFS